MPHLAASHIQSSVWLEISKQLWHFTSDELKTVIGSIENIIKKLFKKWNYGYVSIKKNYLWH